MESPVLMEVVYTTDPNRDYGLIEFPSEQTIGRTSMNLPQDLFTNKQVRYIKFTNKTIKNHGFLKNPFHSSQMTLSTLSHL